MPTPTTARQSLFQTLAAMPTSPSISNQPDPVVYAALCEGDRNALNVIYSRYSTPVYRLALRILKSEDEAADLTHEVFLRLWRTMSYDPSRGQLLAYLMTLTRSQALNRIRTRKNQRKLAERWGRGTEPLHDGQGTMLEAIALTEASSQVRMALAQLPPAQRQVLEMAYYDGLSQSEITQQLAIPLGTVKSRSRQGLLKLKTLLKDLVQ